MNRETMTRAIIYYLFRDAVQAGALESCKMYLEPNAHKMFDWATHDQIRELYDGIKKNENVLN